MLERGKVVEVLWGLDQCRPWVVEVAEGVDQEVGSGDMVGVEHRDDIRLDDPEGVVEVAGLGVATVVATQIAGTQIICQPGDMRPIPIVQDPGLMHRLQRDRGRNGRGEDLQWFVPGRNEHRNPQWTFAHRPRSGPGVHVPEGEGIQAKPERRMELQNIQRDRHPPHRQVDRGHRPPPQVHRRGGQREDRNGTGDQVADAGTIRGGAIRKPGQPRLHLGEPANRIMLVHRTDR